MFLKRLKLANYRKFSAEKNIVEFISSKIVLNQDNDDINDNFGENSVQNDCNEIDVASDTTLIIGKNNAGKTTIITALDNLINHNNAFGANDFNYRYLQEYLDCYDVCNPPLGAPYIEFVLTIGLEEDSNDRISNLIPFMLVEDIEDSELDICIRYEVEDFVYFQLEMKELFSEGKDENAFSKFLNLLHNTDYVLKYYDKNMSKIDVDFKLSNLMELQCIKANHLKNDHCLTDAFNKIINYRYDNIFQKEKKEVTKELEKINHDLTENITKNHTDVIRNVLKELISMERMGVDLSADITFDKLMRDLIKYEYIEDDANIPENQFGLGYTNLVMIIAAIMDYMERYPDSSFNSKINLIYDLLMEFVSKHTSDKFCLINNISTSIRGIISREVIGNILVHRDYSSAYPAKVIIEKDWLRTENWCIPRRHGNIMSDEFTPYPKNPLIQQFFANIGRTDTIGSGVRNLYKYTPMYSDGGKPELIEDDVFRINIPLDRIAADEATEQKTLSEREQKIYNMICENLHLSVEQVMAELDISRSTVFRDYAKIKKITGAMYDKKTSTWTLD